MSHDCGITARVDLFSSNIGATMPLCANTTLSNVIPASESSRFTASSAYVFTAMKIKSKCLSSSVVSPS